ncbi:NUDIX hydrolase [Amaricoccus solimangrovi]|uniref:NUDIX hydrolase n=1 Tax=Amaricoccus solimangrovi TaxID=2589815 RepID=A0A501WLM5_9RHOB|nr:NUDIX hydrolase [Amaricoccus solimangrovi]TPE50248.1 NUDIX hydrolase [Amaricoccus solimangrovi]
MSAAAGAAPPPIRHAATIVLTRQTAHGPEILMGQRSSGAVFMPDKFVFPGGAVDPEDYAAGQREGLPESDPRLLIDTAPPLARALRHAAIRELLEETGLWLGEPDGARPRTEALRFFFRAITPPGRPRRFDARFFLADAGDLAGAADDFSGAGGELGFLSWLDLDAARALDLPFITEIVLAEIAARHADPEVERPVPWFNHTDAGSHFHLLRA